jgi:hypothetical protein
MLAGHAAGGSLNADETCGRPVAVTHHSVERIQRLWATGLLQPGVSDVGHLSAVAMGLVTRQCNTVSKIKCSVAGDKTRLTNVVEDIIGYSWPLCPTV